MYRQAEGLTVCGHFVCTRVLVSSSCDLFVPLHPLVWSLSFSSPPSPLVLLSFLLTVESRSVFLSLSFSPPSPTATAYPHLSHNAGLEHLGPAGVLTLLSDRCRMLIILFE
eukprot:768281-Hanusia_phi.AAC.8